MNPPRVICIGVLADTQVLFDQALVENYCGVDHIVHAGDIGNRPLSLSLRFSIRWDCMVAHLYLRSSFGGAQVRNEGRRLPIRNVYENRWPTHPSDSWPTHTDIRRTGTTWG